MKCWTIQIKQNNPSWQTMSRHVVSPLISLQTSVRSQFHIEQPARSYWRYKKKSKFNLIIFHLYESRVEANLNSYKVPYFFCGSLMEAFQFNGSRKYEPNNVERQSNDIREPVSFAFFPRSWNLMRKSCFWCNDPQNRRYVERNFSGPATPQLRFFGKTITIYTKTKTKMFLS